MAEAAIAVNEGTRDAKKKRFLTWNGAKESGFKTFNVVSSKIESVSIDNEYDYENEILPLTIMRMRFAQNTCSTRSGNSFHDEISSKTRSARNEFLKGKVYLL